MDEEMNSTTLEPSTNSTVSPVKLRDFEMYLFSITVSLGLPSHSYVLWLIITRSNGVASEFLNLNLSICEIGVCVDFFCFLLVNWIPLLMPVAMLLLGLASAGRPLFQCLICVERYLAVVHPVTFLKYKPFRYRAICCTVAWMLIFCSCLVCMFTLMSSNIAAHSGFFSSLFLLFFSIQLFCLVAVLRALKRSGPGDRKREEENNMKRRAFNIILISTVNILIAYGPIFISGVFILLMNAYILTFWAPGLICYVVAGFAHPVLYLHRTGKLSCLWFPSTDKK